MDTRDPALNLRSSASRSWRREDVLALAPAAVLLAALFLGALAGAVKVSLVPLGGGIGDASLASWRQLLADPSFRDGLVLTLEVTIASTAIAAALGVALALALRRSAGAVRAVAAAPVPVPHLLVAVIAVVWLGPGGLADRILGSLPFDLIGNRNGAGIVAVYVYKEAPFIALLVLAAMGRSLEQREEAAAVFGAGGLKRAAWVLWPTIRGPVVVGSIIVAAFAIGALEVPLAVGPNYPPTLAVYAFQTTQGDLLSGEGRAAAALLLAGFLAIVLASVGVRHARSADNE